MTDWSVVLWVLLFTLLIMDVMFPLFKLLATSPDCFNFSNIMESGLATSSTICSGSLLLGSFGLPHLQVPQMALNLVFSCCGSYLILLDPTLRFHELGGQKGDGQNKIEAKKVVEYLSLHISCRQVPYLT